jgi:hypothetical protein
MPPHSRFDDAKRRRGQIAAIRKIMILSGLDQDFHGASWLVGGEVRARRDLRQMEEVAAQLWCSAES